MRLIDADEIRWTSLEDGFGRIKECIAFATDIDAMPAVEVVRCKDCKYCEKLDLLNEKFSWLGQWYGSCKYYNTHSVQADDFCSRAERKEE